MVAKAWLRLCLDGWAGTENWGDYPGLHEVSPGSLLMLKPPKSSVSFPFLLQLSQIPEEGLVWVAKGSSKEGGTWVRNP